MAENGSPRRLIEHFNRRRSKPVSPASTPSPTSSKVAAGSPLRFPRSPSTHGSPKQQPSPLASRNGNARAAASGRGPAPVRLFGPAGAPPRSSASRPPALAPPPRLSQKQAAGSAPVPAPLPPMTGLAVPSILRQGRTGPALPPAPLPAPIARPAAPAPLPTPAAAAAPLPARVHRKAAASTSADSRLPPLPPRTANPTPLAKTVRRPREGVRAEQRGGPPRKAAPRTAAFSDCAVGSLPPAPLPPSVSRASTLPALPSLTGVAIPSGGPEPGEDGAHAHSQSSSAVTRYKRATSVSYGPDTPRALAAAGATAGRPEDPALRSALSGAPLGKDVASSPLVLELGMLVADGGDTAAVRDALKRVREHGSRFEKLRRQGAAQGDAKGTKGRKGGASAWAVMGREESMAVVELLAKMYVSPGTEHRRRVAAALVAYDPESVLEHLTALLERCVDAASATPAQSAASSHAASAGAAVSALPSVSANPGAPSAAVAGAGSAEQSGAEEMALLRAVAEVVAGLAMYANGCGMDVEGAEGEASAAECERFLHTLAEERFFGAVRAAMAVRDVVVGSHMTAVMTAARIDPDAIVSAVAAAEAPARAATHSNAAVGSYQAVCRIKELLGSRQAETREAAVTAIMCLGPMASGVVKELAAVVARDKVPHIRHLALKALGDLGMPYCLPVLRDIQELAMKDKDEHIKRECHAFIERLSDSSEHSHLLLNSMAVARSAAFSAAFAPPATATAAPSSASTSALASTEDTPSSRRLSTSFSKYGSARRRKETTEEAAIKKAISALGVHQATIKAICGYLETNHPEVTECNDKWRRHVKITMKKMAERGLIEKRPATYSL